jgi:hypothetical protein
MKVLIHRIFRQRRRYAAARAIVAAACLGAAACSPAPGGHSGSDVDPMLFASADGGIPSAGVMAPGGAGRLLLPNQTSLPGENFVLTVPGASMFGRISPELVLRAASPLPPPFEFAIARDFEPLPGSPGYSYVVRTPEIGVTCALVAGPGGGSSGTLMRNCVHGDLARALAPLASPYAL